MKVAVVGARGQLGAAVAYEWRAAGHDVRPLDHRAVDITDADAVMDVMSALGPDVILNCAGYNDVDGAEDHPVTALQVNALAVRSLARAARALEGVLVQFSSDFVLDGVNPSPHTEDERPNPRSVYATSKLLGEWFAADAPRAYILRVESLFGSAPDGPPPKGSAHAIFRSLRAGGPTRVFEDRTVSPTNVNDGARAVRELIERRAPYGLYHCVNSGSCTWLEFAREAARVLGV